MSKKARAEWRRRQNLYKMRERAKRMMSTLTLTLENIGKNSKHPKQDYARIFQDEGPYFNMLEACHTAYLESYKSKLKLFAPENIDAIQTACLQAGMKVLSQQQLASRHVRNRVLAELHSKKTQDGQSFLERARILALVNREREESQKKCRLVSSILEIGYDPADFGLTVDSLFEGTMSGKVCIDWRRCKKIRDAVRVALKPC